MVGGASTVTGAEEIWKFALIWPTPVNIRLAALERDPDGLIGLANIPEALSERPAGFIKSPIKKPPGTGFEAAAKAGKGVVRVARAASFTVEAESTNWLPRQPPPPLVQ